MYVADLTVKDAFNGVLPIAATGCELRALDPGAITSVALKSGQDKTASAAMKNTLGLGFPAANRVTKKAGLCCIWTGPGQGFLLGRAPGSIKGASLSDQSDGWAVMQLRGDHAEAVLARLVPIDLRVRVFKPGHAARTLLYHVPLCISRIDAISFRLMVFRSMAGTAVHELHVAMKSVAALSDLTVQIK